VKYAHLLPRFISGAFFAFYSAGSSNSLPWRIPKSISPPISVPRSFLSSCRLACVQNCRNSRLRTVLQASTVRVSGELLPLGPPFNAAGFNMVFAVSRFSAGSTSLSPLRPVLPTPFWLSRQVVVHCFAPTLFAFMSLRPFAFI